MYQDGILTETEVSEDSYHFILLLNKKLSGGRETARHFGSLSILLSRSTSLKIIRNDNVETRA